MGVKIIGASLIARDGLTTSPLYHLIGCLSQVDGNGTNMSILHLLNCRSAQMKSDGEDAHSLNVYKNASTTSHSMREDEGKTDALCSIRTPCDIKAGRVLHVQ